MSLNISRQAEAQLTEEARRRGITVDALLERLIDERAAGVHPAESRKAPELPVWRLGVIGSLAGGISTTMSLEPGIVDTNILVDAPQFAPPRAFLYAARDDPATTLS